MLPVKAGAERGGITTHHDGRVIDGCVPKPLSTLTMRPTIAALGARAVSEVAVTSQPFKRSQFGLFQGKTKQYGNSVPFSLHKTRRTWLPNVQRKRLFSETLQSHVQVKVTTSALKTIKKVIMLCTPRFAFPSFSFRRKAASITT